MATVIMSCQKNEDTFQPSLAEATESDVISVSDALNSLEITCQTLFPETKSTGIQGKIESVEAIGGSTFKVTKSAGEPIAIPDTLFYLVNFRDKQGFAVVSANKLLPEDTYAVTELGSLSVSDFQEAFDFLNTETQVATDSTITDIGELTVPAILLSGIIQDLNYDYVTDNVDTKVSFTTKYGPYTKTKWHQDLPFNKLTNPAYPAGCVAIATAQILVANKKSNTMTFNGVKCNWTDLESVCNYQTPNGPGTTEAQNQVMNFMKIIGDRNHCRIKYGSNGSSGIAEGAQRTFQALGYVDVDKHLGFGKHNQKIAKRVIGNGKAVYLDACKKGSTSGHAWVLDGYAKDSGGKEYYHINWGWNGNRDGYYSCGTFNTEKGQFKDDEIDKNTSINVGRVANYTWDYRLVTYCL